MIRGMPLFLGSSVACNPASNPRMAHIRYCYCRPVSNIKFDDKPERRLLEHNHISLNKEFDVVFDT